MMKPVRMACSLIAGLAALLLVGSCADRATQPAAVATPLVAKTQTFDYQRDIQPIFDRKCIACHACYDSPCQLTLTSAQGVLRGANRLDAYDTSRLTDAIPTRLHVDAQSSADWRKHGFWSVTDTPSGPASMLARMLELGDQHRWQPNQRLPDDLPIGMDRVNVCPAATTMDAYVEQRPLQGMPLAATGLTQDELSTLRTWLREGGVAAPRTIVLDGDEAAVVSQWERWFNRGGLKERLVARYLYEHLFLAHLYVPGDGHPNFFQMVRSSTAPGEPIMPIATVLPDDPPPEGPPFWYRLRPIEDSIVYKTHITYSMDAARLKRYDELFFAQPWTLDRFPSYQAGHRANPFETFAAMPVRARYQFMLDDAEYFVRTFIRGPVCHGQVATDVIRDQFWTLFEHPASDRFVNDAAYRAKAIPLLGVPGQDDSLAALGPEWELYRHRRDTYDRLRVAEYAKARPNGPSMRDLWDGDGANTNALLTIFRHHDSASVHRGLIGAVPDTIWVMDYPLFERTYYELVANYNVFGSVSHQVQTRLYFDLIRNSSELNFLRFLPPAARRPLLKDWYRGMGKLKPMTVYDIVDTKTPTSVSYAGGSPMQAFVDQLERYAKPVLGPADTINRCGSAGCAAATGPLGSEVEILRRLAAGTAREHPFIALLPEVVFVRVVDADGQRRLYSLLHDLAHTNVAFLFAEDRRLDSARDTLTIVPGIIGSYPNFAFNVPAAELRSFAEQLSVAVSVNDLRALADRWGVRRTHPEFWTIFGDFTRYLEETDPISAGIFDMNRYENL